MKKLMIAATVLLLTACESKDLYDPTYFEKAKKEAYSMNFVKTYSETNLNQSWDYSHKNEIYSLPAQSSSARTRAAVDYSYKTGEEYIVDNTTVDWLNEKLIEKKDNRALGNPFYMTVPGNSFTVVPIFQGQASAVFNLHVVIGGVDIKLWDKGQDIWVKKTQNSDWTLINNLSNNEMDKNTMNCASVKVPQYVFENLPVGEEMYFYLEITKQANFNRVGDHYTSLEGMMLALDDCPKPSNLPANSEVMIIACEDAKLRGTDWDMNDVVFMVYGNPDVPKPVKIEEGEPIVKKTTVRYMIEDLGATDDFDFNDIVIDVSDIWDSTPTYTNNVLTGWTDSNYRQEAVIRHLGGQLPFKLTIGDTEFEEHAGVLGSDPNETYTVTGWDKNAHNISVQVRQETNSTVYNNVRFPRAGEAPMIIAVDPTTNWMRERVSVPADWFIVPEE